MVGIDEETAVKATNLLLKSSMGARAQYYYDVSIAESIYEVDHDKGNVLFEEAVNRFFKNMQASFASYDAEMLKINSWRASIKASKRDSKSR